MLLLLPVTETAFLIAFSACFVWGGLILLMVWGGLKWLYKMFTDEKYCTDQQKKYGVFKS